MGQSKMSWETYVDLSVACDSVISHQEMMSQSNHPTDTIRAQLVKSVERYAKLLRENGYEGDLSHDAPEVPWLGDAAEWLVDRSPEDPFDVSAEFLRIERVENRKEKVYGLDVFFVVEVKWHQPDVAPYGLRIGSWEASNANISERVRRSANMEASFGRTKGNNTVYVCKQQHRFARPSEIPVSTESYRASALETLPMIASVFCDGLHDFIVDTAKLRREEMIRNARETFCSSVFDKARIETRFKDKIEAASRELNEWIAANEEENRQKITEHYERAVGTGALPDGFSIGLIRDALAEPFATKDGRHKGVVPF